MGMTIDKSILYMSLYKQRLEESISDGLEEDIEAYDMAISTMRKCQKIEQIVSDFRKYQKGITWGFGGEKYMQMVSEVIEEGNDDCRDIIQQKT